MAGGTDHKYSFFDKMDKDSIYKALKDLDSGTGAKLVSQSTSYIECNDTINNEQARSICLIFNSLLEKLCSIKSTETNSTLNEGDCKYLNYWLNVQLNSSKLNTSEIISGIFKKLNIKNKNCFKKETMIEKLSHIKKEDIQEMEILNNLYAIYSELNEIFFSSKGNQNSTCLNISNKCSDQYELAIKSCRKQNSDCYKALQNFKTTYELLTTTPVTGNACSSSDIKLFRPAEEILKENSLVTNVEQNRSSSVTPILVSTLGLSFSLIFLYMFTPFGNWLRSKIKLKKEAMNNLTEMRHHSITDTYNSKMSDYDQYKYNISYNS